MKEHFIKRGRRPQPLRVPEILSQTGLTKKFVFCALVLILIAGHTAVAKPFGVTGAPPQETGNEKNTSITLSLLSTPPLELDFPVETGYPCKVAIRNTGKHPARIPFILVKGEHSRVDIKVGERVMIDRSGDGLFILPKSLKPGEEKVYTLHIIPEKIGEETLTFGAGGQNIPDPPPGMTITFRIVYAANAAPGKWGFAKIAGLSLFMAIVLAAVLILRKRRRTKAAENTTHPQKEVAKEEGKDSKQGLPAVLILSSSVREIESDGKEKAELTVKVLDRDSRPIVGQVVEFVAIDRGTILPIDKFTGEGGIAKALFLPEAGSGEDAQVGALCPDYPEVKHRIIIKHAGRAPS